ncbi:MAG: CPBP family intramembrane metalloprotease, partial [Gluconacetobacter diazotrophicus]|nr:CPBP family intramembrane metalloprotease [Gluconacetobacter diazotrophicus]
ALLGSIVLLWWAAMLVLQGEGLELDLQRRRHPMWEWLYSHPVSAASIFTAEILAPLAANPVYWGAPLFVGAVYGMVYDPLSGIVAAVLAGVPVAVAAACLGKALEISATVRLSPRSRGALLGLMSWFGYASMMLLLLGAATATYAATVVGRVLAPLTAGPWPWLGWFLGRRADGTFSFVAGLAACWLASGLTAALAVRVCVWGTRRGLSGNFGGLAASSPVAASRPTRFGRDGLYRKEFLWFARDRSAVVQTILIPLTVAGFQAYNVRGALHSAQGAWNYLCGAAILFGTYFLWVLGPKSLASEGSALWLALTWPRGLESLLKAKAWLWSLISTGIVVVVLAYAGYLFPADAWKVALVGMGWLVFARSMAEKTVTLVTVTSESGEPEPVPRGRRWAASLGMLTFAIGVLTQQWSLAVVGVVYSYLTAAAMWENFRARMPFLYDPWSERLPPPPTLMHAMVAISLLVEGTALISAPLLLLGRENLAVARSVAYALCALAVSVGVSRFLNARDVRAADVWRWRVGGREGVRFWPALLLGVGGGVALGLLAHGYTALLMHVPTFAEAIRQGREQMAKVPGLHASYVFCAVAVAPFAEEYLFRGLLFRALDREWGGWRAVAGSAAFFAIYHPPLAWLPVGLLGAANALLFKNTGRLLPAVLLHMMYNAVVLLW